MKRLLPGLLAAMLAGTAVNAAPPASADVQAGERHIVIVLHGLARSPRAMRSMTAALQQAGFEAINVGYPSTQHPVETLVAEHLAPEVRRQVQRGATRIDFVTHSMGGILVRELLATQTLPQLGRVVMLGPPNRGSELVDRLGWLPVFDWVNGPAGRQLGTGPDALPHRLGPVRFPLGVIAGTRSWNPLYSALIPGPDDGKVSVTSTRPDGDHAFISVPVVHTFLMDDAVVQAQTVHFLRHGAFSAP